MSNKLVALRDAETNITEFVNLDDGFVYADAEGQRKLRQMHETDTIMADKDTPLRGPDGRIVHVHKLHNVATEHYYRCVAKQLGIPSWKVEMREFDGEKVLLDLGVSDVHTNAALPNIALGYSIEAEGVADIASPVVMVPKASDVYYTWNAKNDFNRKIPNATSPGGEVPQVNPTLSASTYTTVEYALGGFLPTEVQSNADTPLQPFSKLVQMVVDGLRLEREIRVANLLQTSSNWNSNLVNTILAGSQWDGGGSADPIANLHHAIEQSFKGVTGIVWSELVHHDFVRSPAVQKFIQSKINVGGIPSLQEIATEFGLPPIHVGRMKYATGGTVGTADSTIGAATYVWGNHVVLLRTPSQMPPTSQMDIASSYTFRWNGGLAPDGSLNAGLLVRTFWDPKRGARGGTSVVVTHNDLEAQTTGLTGGLLLNAHQ